jgi:hypothetical protein
VRKAQIAALALGLMSFAMMQENWDHSDQPVIISPLGGITRGWHEIGGAYQRIFSSPGRERKLSFTITRCTSLALSFLPWDRNVVNIRQTMSISSSRPVQQTFFDALPKDNGSRSITTSPLKIPSSWQLTKLPFGSLRSGRDGLGTAGRCSAVRRGGNRMQRLIEWCLISADGFVLDDPFPFRDYQDDAYLRDARGLFGRATRYCGAGRLSGLIRPSSVATSWRR